MKVSVAILALAAAVSAQSITDIPACAQPCILEGVASATTCESTDYKCICANKNAVVGAATSCVILACGAEVATGQVLPATEKFCAAVEAGGGATTSTSAAPSTTAAPTSSSEPSSTEAPSSTTDLTITTSTSATTFATTSANATTTTGVYTNSTTSSKTSATSKTTATTGISTGAAAVAGSIGTLGMAILGAVAFL